MPSSTITIEEVYGGGGNSGSTYKNDYVVLHNLTNSAVSLAGLSVQYASATGTSGTFTSATPLSGSIAAGGYFLIQESQGTAGSANLPTPDLVPTGSGTTLSISGTGGKVALVNGTALISVAGAATASNVIDFVGWGGTTNNYEGAGPAPATTNTTSVIRVNSGNTDTDNNSADFATVTPDTGAHAPFNSQSPVHPANGGGATSLSIADVTLAEGNSGQTAFTFTVTRSGDLSAATTVHFATADGTATVADGDYAALSGDLTFAAGVATQTLSVQVNGDTRTEPNETFSVALSNPTSGVTFGKQTATGVITNDDVSLTSIGAIQGAATTSPFVGATVTTSGVVTAIKTGSGGGYYIQDATNAGPAGASHGLFVFTAATPGVAVGDHVTVQGLVTEYAANANDRPITELNNPTTTVDSHNNATTPVIIGAGGILPPTETIAGSTYDPAHNGADFYESLEGQLVTIKNAQATDATYSGSTWVVADNGAEATGMNSRGGITISATDFNPERIQVYSTALNATMGEHLGDITGVITYYNGEYELVPTTPVTPPGNSATTPPALPLETTTLKGDAGHLSLAAYNVENLGPVQPGVAQATVDARFALLGKDIAQNLGAPDILGLEEIQDTDGEGTGADLSGAATLNKLIAAIAAAGGPTYQFVEIDPTSAGSTGGAPGGNIRSAYLYNPARVQYVAGSAQLISDPNLSDGDAFNNSRKPLAAQFTFNGHTINAIDVHDYARSGSEELFGLDQPPVNSGDQRRVDQTAAVKAYVAQLLAANPNADVTVQGDFNGFQFEPTLTQLTHSGGGQLNQLSDLLPAAERYSTTFEGLGQEIDHQLVSDSLFSGAQFDIVHVNTGQTAANQGSDHDPIVSLLSVPAPGAVNANPPVFTSGTAASTPENAPAATVVYTAHATDADGDTLTYAFAGGADDARFNIDAATGAVTFKASPDYEAPASAAGTNTYLVKVSASDGVAAHTTVQTVAISVTDVADTPNTVTPAPPAVAPGQTAVITASATATITGNVSDSGVLQIAASASVSFTGSISGTGSLEKAGSGVLTLSGVSTYTGATNVTGGKLVVDGSIAASTVVVGAGADLGGHGVTGDVTLQSGASVSPGNSPGVISTGSLALAAGATLNEEIGGVGAGGFDQIRVTGAVNLNGATLNTTLYGGFAAPAAGSTPLVIIDNDGTDAVVGTFAGLAEGAVFTLGGQQVRISYAGGTGNDVTLQFVPPAGGGGGGFVTPPAPALPPSQQAGYATQVGNLLRVAANDPALSDTRSPLYAQAQAEKAIAAQLDAGQLSAADAQTALFHLADGTTSVAEISYSFFTGKTPTAAGLGYLVHSAANSTDLNDAYYAQFTTENRYINFGVNLATGAGAGAAAFQAAYGSLSLQDATSKAYQAVFGVAPTADKVAAILNAQVSNGLGGTETRAQYLSDISGGSPIAQKAAVAGFLLADSVKEGFGAYQQADLHFLQDLAHGTAAFNVDLLAAYTAAPALVGQPVTDAAIGG